MLFQDIRSFFTVVGKKKGDEQKKDPSPVKKKICQRKRVIESDSDEDQSPPKRTKGFTHSKRMIFLIKIKFQ